jgi:thioredoxin reductase/ferredoxin
MSESMVWGEGRGAGGWWGRYLHWLHLRWPAGLVEKLPEVREDGTCGLAGVRVVGDLTGVPLLKFAANSGARAVRAFAAEGAFAPAEREAGVLDLAIVGGGVAGWAAALEARALGLNFVVFEANGSFSTIANFPKGKPIFLYPGEFQPEGALQMSASVKEDLVAELEAQRTAAGLVPEAVRIERLSRSGGAIELHHAGGGSTRARRVVVAIGRSGNFRRLGCPGEEDGRVFNRLHDPAEYAGRAVLVVGGGDSALETAIALGQAGARVTLSYRGREFSRPKPENVERVRALDAAVQLRLGTKVVRVGDAAAELSGEDGRSDTVPADAVFAMLGREAPLDFFRRSGIPIRGEWRPATWVAFGAFFLFCCWLYLWKAGGSFVHRLFEAQHWFPFQIASLPAGHTASNLAEVMQVNWRSPSFYYSIAYCVLVSVFGVRRIVKRRTPYVTRQTLVLAAFQWVPLFLLPYVVFPAMGAAGWFDDGAGRAFADALFPATTQGHGREYWRAFGFVLAWPLFIWNVFTEQPLWAWLGISLVQTLVIIPWIVRRWGKGAYCGWVCSCGALAETLGDAHRHKMPHGPRWNRMNVVGQVILWTAVLLLLLRVIGWMPWGGWARGLYGGLLSGWSVLGVQLNYYHIVDILLAGIVGVGAYFWFSGRVWCRFACPLAALMHIYARFSKFRIFADKKKCISCNVCTTVCHQGIDVMNFANKGAPMEDPQCVRCSACVQSCPTGVLSFGRVETDGAIVLDRLAASPVRVREDRGGG